LLQSIFNSSLSIHFITKSLLILSVYYAVRIVRNDRTGRRLNHENAPDHPRRVRKTQKEMDYLWREERPEVTKKVTWAASLGDRSENADYQYNKKRLREIDRRVRYLTKCLEI
jgi:hypothetical protein